MVQYQLAICSLEDDENNTFLSAAMVFDLPEAIASCYLCSPRRLPCLAPDS